MIPADATDLDYPFECARNGHSGEVHEETVAWAVRMGFIDSAETYVKVRETNIGGLAGLFHPEAGREQLRLISDFYIWMFFRDDLCDESEMGRDPKLLAESDTRCLSILRGDEVEAGDAPLTGAMHDLRRRLEPEIPSRVWMRRFVRSVAEHFESTLWEAMNRSRGQVPDLKTYVRMRPITGGMYVDADLIEVSSDVHLPQDVHESGTVRALTRMSNNAVCWANDLFSLEKELASDDVHNIVLVIRNEHGVSLPAAVRVAREMHDGEVRAFMELEKSFTESLPVFGPTVDRNIERYVSVLRARMRGNLDWSRESARYGGPGRTRV